MTYKFDKEVEVVDPRKGAPDSNPCRGWDKLAEGQSAKPGLFGRKAETDRMDPQKTSEERQILVTRLGDAIRTMKGVENLIKTDSETSPTDPKRTRDQKRDAAFKSGPSVIGVVLSAIAGVESVVQNKNAAAAGVVSSAIAGVEKEADTDYRSPVNRM